MKIGQRQTRQRLVLLEILHNADRPLSITNLLQLAKKKKTKIGQATVYRTINALLESGQIRQVQLPHGESLYEKAHLHHHHHFKCEQCNRVFDLPGCPEKELHQYLPSGFRATHHELTFYGTCAECS